MITLVYILSAAVLLGLCIFVHELGHLLGGKMVGIKAEVFSIGYGKGFLKKKIGDTTYQLAYVPFGGYCKFYGEDAAEERKGVNYEFLTAAPWRRIVTVVMGPLFNLIFGILLFFSMNLIGYTTETNRVSIPDYLQSKDFISPAWDSGLRTGDRITQINEHEITRFSDIQFRVMFSEGKTLNVKAERDGNMMNFAVKPDRFTEKGHYSIGVLPYGERVLIMGMLNGDVAQKSGIEEFDEVKSINGKQIKEAKDFTDTIRANAGNKLVFDIVRAGNEKQITAIPRVREVITINQFENNKFKGEKFDVVFDKIDLVKNAIKNKKLKVNDKSVASFDDFKKIISANKDKIIKIENSGGVYTGIVKYETYGFIGVETTVSPEMIDVRYGVISALAKSLTEPYEFVVMNLKGMGMLFAGELDVRQNLSGPIRIAKIAGDVAYYRGISAFILLMAKISIILMVMNLLPIPAVDGSFILFFLFEAIRGKAINEKILEKIQMVGVTLLIILGVFIIFNDLSFFPFFQNLFK